MIQRAIGNTPILLVTEKKCPDVVCSYLIDRFGNVIDELTHDPADVFQRTIGNAFSFPHDHVYGHDLNKVFFADHRQCRLCLANRITACDLIKCSDYHVEGIRIQVTELVDHLVPKSLIHESSLHIDYYLSILYLIRQKCQYTYRQNMVYTSPALCVIII